MQKSENRISPGIQCFAFNGDSTLCAVCPQSKEILIFKTNGQKDISKWTLDQTLKHVSLSLSKVSSLKIFLLC